MSVGGAGDIDGDGFADLVVGANGVSSSDGGAYVYRGGPSGLGGPADSVITPHQTLMSPTGGEFGVSVASASDVDGDGFADVIIGAYRVASDDGAAYVYRGGPSGLGAMGGAAVAPHQSLIGPTGSEGWFGRSVTSAGDVDGDGAPDVVVGASRVRGDDGAAYLYRGGSGGLGGPSGSALTPDSELAGPAAVGERFGFSVASAELPRTTLSLPDEITAEPGSFRYVGSGASSCACSV